MRLRLGLPAVRPAAFRQPPRVLCYNPRKFTWEAKFDMLLKSMLTLAETLKERVTVLRDADASETLTRYALIDPLLRELGWDTSDPSMVVPEYSSGSGRADYALMSTGRPAMMVEAKKLGTPLRDRVLEQGIGYCLMEGTPHFTITDGARWEIYRAFIPDTPIDERRIVEFDLSADSPASFSLKALALWRPSVESGSVAAGQPSLIETSPAAVETSESQSSNEKVQTPGDWHRFTDTGYAKGRKPVELQLPDNTRTALKGWFSLLVGTTRWLSANGHLTSAHCPIMPKGAGAKRYIVHTEPTHSDGKEFTKPVKVNGLFVNTHPQVGFHFGYAKTVIERVGQDPSQFRVRFAD